MPACADRPEQGGRFWTGAAEFGSLANSACVSGWQRSLPTARRPCVPLCGRARTPTLRKLPCVHCSYAHSLPALLLCRRSPQQRPSPSPSQPLRPLRPHRKLRRRQRCTRNITSTTRRNRQPPRAINSRGKYPWTPPRPGVFLGMRGLKGSRSAAPSGRFDIGLTCARRTRYRRAHFDFRVAAPANVCGAVPGARGTRRGRRRFSFRRGRR